MHVPRERPIKDRAAELGRSVRPGWLTTGALRMALLCGAIVAIGMLPWDMTPHRAGVVFFAGVAVVVGGGAFFALATRRVAGAFERIPAVGPVAGAVLVLLRRTGLPLLGLAFFLAWTFGYIGLWWFHPDGPDAAFGGLPETPRFADFFYYSVSTAFISPPGDIIATSRGVRSATMIEMLTGLALLTAYVSSFVDWRVPGRGEPPPPPAA